MPICDAFVTARETARSGAIMLLVGGACCFGSASAEALSYVAADIRYVQPDVEGSGEEDVGLGVSVGQALNRRLDLEIGYWEDEFPPDEMPGLLRRKNILFNSIAHFNPRRIFSPYFSLGVGASRTTYNGETDVSPLVSSGLGYTWPVRWIPGMDVQPEIRFQYIHNGGDVSPRNQVDTQALIRISYSGSPSSTAPAVRSLPVAGLAVASGKPRSLSIVCESLDPGTSAYVQNQCESFLDRDKDSIPDMVDRCPNTIPRVRVDTDGCLLPP